MRRAFVVARHVGHPVDVGGRPAMPGQRVTANDTDPDVRRLVEQRMLLPAATQTTPSRRRKSKSMKED